MQKNNLALTFGCGDLIVLRSRQSFGEFSELMIVSRKQCLSRVLGGVVQILRDGPGDRQSVKGCCAATNLIEQDKRTRRRAMQDCCRLSHLDHKSRTPACQVI